MNNTEKINFRIVFRTIRYVVSLAPYESLLSFFLYILEGIIPAITVVITASLFDTIALFIRGEETYKEVTIHIVTFIFIYAIDKLLDALIGLVINAGLYEKMNNACKLEIYDKSSKLSVIQYESSKVINLKDRALGCIRNEILTQIYLTIVVIAVNSISIVSVIIVLSNYNILFLIIALLCVAPYYYVMKKRGKEFYKIKKKHIPQERLQEYLWKLMTRREPMKEMKIMGYSNYLIKKWRMTKQSINDELLTFNVTESSSLMKCDIIKSIGYTSALLLSFALVMTNRIMIGAFGACITAFASVQNEWQLFLTQYSRLSSLCGFAKDYYDYLDLENQENIGLDFPGLKNEIKMENVSFSYPDEAERAIKEINLVIRKGEKIALVGPNGSGKTTLTRLLSGIFFPSNGKILYDGGDITSFSSESIRKRISVVSQEFGKYEMSLLENITMSQDIGQDTTRRVEKVIKRLGIDEIVQDNEYETILGKEFGGLELSEGQWQRVAIARAMYKDSDIVILDEPTSALDPITESKILKSFIESFPNQTSIIVTHRIGICTKVDRIILMENGEIKGDGTHRDLYKSNELYYRMFEAQKKWYFND